MIERKNFEKYLYEFLHLVKDVFESNDNYLYINETIVNTNKVQIRNVSLSNFQYYFKFFIAVEIYRQKLKRIAVIFDEKKWNDDKIQVLNFESRIKNISSIFAKIYYYNNVKEEKGKICINKCLNDLYGLRISVPFFTFKKLNKFINAFIAENNLDWKYYNATKNGYRAMHLYIYNNNKEIRWEIQFWLRRDYTNNRLAHAKYKQAYITWEKEFVSGGLVEVVNNEAII